MQFISYDSDGTEGSQLLPTYNEKLRDKPTETTIAGTSLIASLPPSWTIESSSDEDSDDEINIKNISEGVHNNCKSTLLDAETLFASTTAKPKFLSRNIDETFKVSAVKAHAYDNIDSSAASMYQKKNESVGKASRAVPMALLATKVSTPKIGEPVSESDLALKKKLDDRETAKVSVDVFGHFQFWVSAMLTSC